MIKKYKLNLDEKSQFAVFGLGRFGGSIAKELARSNHNIFCCDLDERVVQEASHYIDHVAQADSTNDDFLDNIGISQFDVVIVAFSNNFEGTVLTVMKLKERNVAFIIAKANDERHKTVLEKVGADYVVLPEVIMGERLAHALIYNDPLTHIYESDFFEIDQMQPKKTWLNKPLRELQLTKNDRISVLGIIRSDTLVDKINSETVILEDDILIIMRNLA